ncbi:MAG TPA: hypothetical protein VGR35_06830 [Tepidisphaeraceae bacterium]|nr:hypothetical protein [Tepidisphaeraceae bacterium]
MVSSNAQLAFDTDLDADLHTLRRRRHAPQRESFMEIDTFEGVASDPITLHKYQYGNANPVMNTDPTGQFSVTGLVVTAGITGIVSAMLTGAYGYAQGWSAGEIARASTYAFVAGALGGAFTYGLAWGLAAGAAISSGFVAAEASAFSGVGWTAAGLITTPTTLGISIANFIATENDPEASDIDKKFARFNLAISAFVFVGVHARTIGLNSGVAGPFPGSPAFKQTIDEIKALPPGQQLTAAQLEALRQNAAVLRDSIASNPNNPRVVANVLKLIQEDPRFANLSDAQRQAFVAEVIGAIKK